MSNEKQLPQIEPLEYWLISVPYEQEKEDSIKKSANQLLSNVGSYGECNLLDWHIPQKLRVGTLDSLISLSDEFNKIDAYGKTIVQKLHRTYLELEENNSAILDVFRKPIRTYITSFEWDDGYFDSKLQLKDLINKIHANMLKTSENLRKLTQSLSEIQSNLTSIERKKTGSLMTKSLQSYINKETWVSGDYLTTALIVIPKNKKEEFESNYQNFENTSKAGLLEQQYLDKIKNHDDSNNVKHEHEHDNEQKKDHEQIISHEQSSHNNDNISLAYNSLLKSKQVHTVVPDSGEIIGEDEEFFLYRVICLKKGYEWFRNICREYGYNVRTYSLDDNEFKDDQIKLEQLKKEEENTIKKLKLYCKNTFSETFSNWFHLKIIRIFVESVLRFGLPVRFIINVIKPAKGQDKKLLKHLDRQYSHLTDKILQQPTNDSDIDYSGLSTDFHPYVFIPCRVDLI